MLHVHVHVHVVVVVVHVVLYPFPKRGHDGHDGRTSRFQSHAFPATSCNLLSRHFPTSCAVCRGCARGERESSPTPVLVCDAAHNRGRKHSASHAHAVAVSTSSRTTTPPTTPLQHPNGPNRAPLISTHKRKQSKHACKFQPSEYNTTAYP